MVFEQRHVLGLSCAPVVLCFDKTRPWRGSGLRGSECRVGRGGPHMARSVPLPVLAVPWAALVSV